MSLEELSLYPQIPFPGPILPEGPENQDQRAIVKQGGFDALICAENFISWSTDPSCGRNKPNACKGLEST